MQVIEIEENLAVRIGELAKSENKSLTEFIDLTLRETLSKKTVQRTDEEKLKRFIQSYQKVPQQPEEYEIWQTEQAWEPE